MGVISNGTTLLDAGALDSGIATGAMTLLSTVTASSSATVSFASGITSTYKEYIFKFYDVHPQNDGRHFRIGFRDGGTNYDATTTTTYFNGYHEEGDGTAVLQYEASIDQAQSTDPVKLNGAVGYDNDECLGGYLRLFNPSSTTFVKHFISEISSAHDAPAANHCFAAGYCNVTAAIDGVQFTMNTGNIDSGTFKMYGVK